MKKSGVSKSSVFTDTIKAAGSAAKDKTPVFGIDLGTTNSAISVVRSGNTADTIKLNSGKMTMPSCVMYRNGEFIVGDEAYAHKNEPNVVYSIKRHMEDDDYTVTLDDNGDCVTLSPVEVSAKILRGLVDKTDGKYGEVKDVIVTVPAYFSQIGRDNTKEACLLAGLNPINIINEPTAASMLYPTTKSITALFYDLGGGTFDVTLAGIECSDVSSIDDIYGLSSDSSSERVITVYDTNGDTRLGGDDIDNNLVDIYVNRLKQRYDIDFYSTPKDFQIKVRAALVTIKNSLTGPQDLAKISRNTSSFVNENGEHVEVTIDISAEDLAAALKPTFDKTIALVDKVIKDNEQKPSVLVLVGGSTKHPLLRAWLAEKYPDIEINSGFEPDLSVSGGAAVFGKTVKFGTGDAHVFDIIPQAIGIASAESNNIIIPRKTPIPCSGERMFTTNRDNQTAIDVTVLQGGSERPEACTQLGVLHIEGIKPQAKQTVPIRVKVSVDITNTLRLFVAVDGQEKEMFLDLKGAKSSKDARKEHSIAGWLEMAASLPEDKYNYICELCDEYRAGRVKAGVIMRALNE